MHTDTSSLEDGALLEGDICIVGAGAAGISMALDWIGTPYRVILLEGGGFDVEAEMQSLYAGESLGQRYFPLEAARLHFFGGTTGHWAGFCSPYDPIDFKPRPWIPHSGWPIAREALDPFYARAQEIVELGPYRYDPAYWEGLDPDVRRLPLDESVVHTKMWQFSPPTRFGTHYRDEIVNAPNVHLFTHANVCNIEANESVTGVERLDVRCFDGKTIGVKARHYVLACGAIQNARLLLASNRQAPRGLGNDYDLVGRYFMEHLEVNSAFLRMPVPGPMKMYLWEVFTTKARGELALSEAEQEKHGILNGTVSLKPLDMEQAEVGSIDWFPSTAEGSIERMDAMKRAAEEGKVPRHDPSTIRDYQLFTRLEQAPNPDSRVVLSRKTDALGMPIADLDWQITALEKHSIRTIQEVLGRELGRAGLGRVQLMDWLLEGDDAWPPFLGAGWHHMGTTRMHVNPREGVVDPDCKVHGLHNLHVAGSAAYTTAGAANPTLTLIALSLRLSDHLKGEVG